MGRRCVRGILVIQLMDLWERCELTHAAGTQPETIFVHIFKV